MDIPEENVSLHHLPLFPCPLGLWFWVQGVRTVTKRERKNTMNTSLSGTEHVSYTIIWPTRNSYQIGYQGLSVCGEAT